MKRLLILVLVASGLWFAYWFIASNAAKTGYESWFAARQAEGWQAEYSNLTVAGFPNRIDATFDRPLLADPDTGLAWSAPWFQLFALSYRPNHLIANWAPSQQIATPDQKIEVTSEKMQASLVLGAEATLPLTRSNFASGPVSITSDADWTLKAESLLAALHQDDMDDSTYQIGFRADGVAPPNILRNDLLPETMTALELDLIADFDRPWDLRALEDRRPQPTRLALKQVKAEWGELLIQAAGTATFDQSGAPTGELTLRAKNWQEMIEIARASGQFSEVSLTPLEQGLALLASLTGSASDIDVTLVFRNNTTWVGILPIGPAPRLRLR